MYLHSTSQSAMKFQKAASINKGKSNSAVEFEQVDTTLIIRNGKKEKDIYIKVYRRTASLFKLNAGVYTPW